jgi:hypothetical protein
VGFDDLKGKPDDFAQHSRRLEGKRTGMVQSEFLQYVRTRNLRLRRLSVPPRRMFQLSKIQVLR